MSKTKSPKPAADRGASQEQAQGSLFPEAPATGARIPDIAAKSAPTPALTARKPKGERKRPAHEPSVRGRRRPQPKGLAEFYDKLLSAGDYVEATVTLRPSMVGTHPAHPDQIVGGGAEAIKTLRYAIMANAGGAQLGNVLVHGENRFTLVAPLIQERVTIHINLAAAAMRADIAAESFLARASAGERRSA